MQINYLEKSHFNELIHALKQEGHNVLGPVIQEGAILYQEVEDFSQFPIGYSDIQSPGSYQLVKNENNYWFDWANGPQLLKPLTFSAKEVLWKVEKKSDDSIDFTDQTLDSNSNKTAVIAARACDLAALAIQDKHFLQSSYTDKYYQKRRESLFIVAVNCNHPAETCFCASTGDGPSAKSGFDLLLTELEEGFLIEPGSKAGEQIQSKLTLSIATAAQQETQFKLKQAAINCQTRKLPDANIKQSLRNNQSDTHWNTIANRCLACGNCTSVCPTCFCHSEHDEQALNGKTSLHVRQWDSCFNQDHSYIHGITIRAETKFRYRQWLTHKFSYWHDQYGQSGCVGCGRCITWCPTEIDITQELETLCGDNDE